MSTTVGEYEATRVGEGHARPEKNVVEGAPPSTPRASARMLSLDAF